MRPLLIVGCVACGHHDAPRETPRPAVGSDAAGSIDASAIDAFVPADAPGADAVASDYVPAAVYLRIVEVTDDRGGALITLDGGNNRDIRPSWHATIVGDDKRPIEHGEVTIRLIDDTRTRVRSKLAPSVVLAKYHTVRFLP